MRQRVGSRASQDWRGRIRAGTCIVVGCRRKVIGLLLLLLLDVEIIVPAFWQIVILDPLLLPAQIFHRAEMDVSTMLEFYQFVAESTYQKGGKKNYRLAFATRSISSFFLIA